MVSTSAGSEVYYGFNFNSELRVLLYYTFISTLSQVSLTISLHADIKMVSQIILANELRTYILPYPYCYILFLWYRAEA
jgi:hypothetical protein